jgi:hypothetical protein
METFSNLEDITPTELKHAQRCRLYLGVTMVADITSSNGMDICGWALQGQRTRSPTHIFPRQERPSSRVWKTWNHLLHRGYSTRASGKLD